MYVSAYRVAIPLSDQGLSDDLYAGCSPAFNASAVPGSPWAGKVSGQIGPGMLVLLGVAQGDTEADARQLAEKIGGLRIFRGPQGKR